MYCSAFAYLNYCTGVIMSVTTHIVNTAEFYNKTVQVQWHLSTVLVMYLNGILVGY